jgi:hypothetical protein
VWEPFGDNDWTSCIVNAQETTLKNVDNQQSLKASEALGASEIRDVDST